MKSNMQKIEKTIVDDEIILDVIIDNGNQYFFHIDDYCKIIATSGRPITGKISYIGDAHLEINTNTHKLMILFSSIYLIEESNA